MEGEGAGSRHLHLRCLCFEAADEPLRRPTGGVNLSISTRRCLGCLRGAERRPGRGTEAAINLLSQRREREAKKCCFTHVWLVRTACLDSYASHRRASHAPCLGIGSTYFKKDAATRKDVFGLFGSLFPVPLLLCSLVWECNDNDDNVDDDEDDGDDVDSAFYCSVKASTNG